MEDAYSPLTPLTQDTVVILIALTRSRIYLSLPHRLHCISVANLGTTTPCKSTAPCHVICSLDYIFVLLPTATFDNFVA